MNYLDLFRARTAPENNKMKIESNLSQDFKMALRRSPNKVKYSLRNSEVFFDGLLISSTKNQSEFKVTFSLLTELERNYLNGDIISIYDSILEKNRFWLILHKEVKPFYGYIKYKVLELQNELLYIDTNKKKQKMLCYIVGSKDSELSNYFKTTPDTLVELPYKTLNIITNSNTKVNENSRFIIKNKVWKYIDEDDITIDGVSYITLQQTQYDKNIDDLEEEISYPKEENTKFIKSSISNDSNINVGDSVEFFVFQNNKLLESELYFDIKTEDIFKTNGENSIIATGIGPGALTVYEHSTGFSQDFYFNIVENNSENYFNLIGDLNIPELISKKLFIKTTKNYSIDYDKKVLNIQYEDDGIIITGLKKGEHKLTFKTIDNDYQYTIKVTSAWM